MDFSDIYDIVEIDSDISKKCEHLVIYNSRNFRASLTDSFLHLNECTYINFHDIENYNSNDVDIILTNFRNMLKIREFDIIYPSRGLIKTSIIGCKN